MKERLNYQIKHREGFRPFAPSCLEGNIPSFIVPRAMSVYAVGRDRISEGTTTSTCRSARRRTSRVQTVSRKQNTGYYDVISAFFEATDCPIY